MAMSENTKKLLAYGIPIALAVVGLVIVSRSKKSSSTSTTSTATTTGTVAVTPSGEVQASQQELATYESYTEQQIAGLASAEATANKANAAALTAAVKGIKTALEGLSAGPIPTNPNGGASPQPVPAPAPTTQTHVTEFVGSGVDYTNQGSAYGYQGVHTGTAAGAAERSGLTLYYSPAQGVFTPVTGQSNLAPTTGLYLKKTPSKKAA